MSSMSPRPEARSIVASVKVFPLGSLTRSTLPEDGFVSVLTVLAALPATLESAVILVASHLKV